MASPHSAGEVALLWPAQPALIGQVPHTEWLIMHTADPIADDQCGGPGPPNNVYGWGRINAYEAVRTALGLDWGVAWLTISQARGALGAGETADIQLALDSTDLAPHTCY